MHDSKPSFGPLVAECDRRGIGKTTAFDLAKRGILRTFHLGRKRYVYIDSLDSLPERLAEAEAISPRTTGKRKVGKRAR